MAGSGRRVRLWLVVGRVAVAAVLVAAAGPAAPAVAAPTAAVGASAPASVSAVLAAKKKPKAKASVAATVTVLTSGKLRVTVTSNAKKVKVTYRTARNKKRSTTVKVRSGAATKVLATGSKKVYVKALATSRLRASPTVKATAPTPVAVPAPAPAPVPPALVVSAGGTYVVSPTSPILGSMAGYASVNANTYAYYLLRSYLEAFEAVGGGTLVLTAGRFEVSNTLYVPSNVTIRLSEGTAVVKSNVTGTDKFGPSSSLFMLIRPSLGKVPGAVGGHGGETNIHLVGAGPGRSVIDLAGVYNALAIISGHNTGVSISGITFTNMLNNHFVEMDACADCSITGNEFLTALPGTRVTAEAINLDTPDPVTGGFGSVWSNLDGTANVRVTVANNRFDGMVRALGTHNFTPGSFHTDITVTGNVVTNSADDAFQIMNWTNPVFTGNSIAGAPAQAGIRACGTSNPTISGNTFTTSSSAVVFRTCVGDHQQPTAPNAVSPANVTALQANTVGPGLGTASVWVPDVGTVWFAGWEPTPTPTPTP